MPTYEIKYSVNVGAPALKVTRNLNADDYAAFEYAKNNLSAAVIYSIKDLSDVEKPGRKLDLRPLAERFEAKAEQMKANTAALKAVDEPEPEPEPEPEKPKPAPKKKKSKKKSKKKK